MTEVITLIQLAVAILSFAILVAYLLVKIPYRYRLKLLLIPATFGLALYMGLTIPNLLGYAYPGKPQGQFVYVSHTVKNGKVTLLTQKDGSMRLYTFKGDPETLQELAQAQAMTQQGQTVTGEFKNGGQYGFPGLFSSTSPLQIHAPPNYGMLPPKGQ